MSGLIGIYSGTNRTLRTQQVMGIDESLYFRNSFSTNIYSKRHIIMGNALYKGLENQTKYYIPISIKGITVTLNGAVYDFNGSSHKFVDDKSGKNVPDTELLINLYLKYGEKFLKIIDGEYALALYDENNDKLILAVDHLGIKPLYYYFSDGVLIFSSQINQILRNLDVKKEFNQDALYDCFTLGACRDGDTLYKGIKKVAGGTYIRVNKRNLDIRRYRYFTEINRLSFLEKKEAVYVSKLEHLLIDSISSRSTDNAEICTSLSGGIDSSLISYYLSKNRPDAYKLSLDLSKFSKSWDENAYREEAIKIIPGRNILVCPKLGNASGIMSDVLSYIEDFAFHPVVFANYFIMKSAQQNNIRIILSGEGSDELFLGYDHYAKLMNILYSKNIYRSFEKYLFHHRYGQVIQNIFFNFLGGRHLFFSHHFFYNQNTKSLLLNFRNAFPTEELISNDLRQFSNLEYLNQFIIGELRYKFRGPLTMVNSMASKMQIELRFPYLTQKIIDFSLCFPVNKKIYKGITKYPMKDLAAKIFSAKFAFREKIGLTFSINYLIKKNTRKSLLNKIIDSNYLIKEGFISKNYVRYVFRHILVKNCYSYTDELLIMFFFWFNYYFEDKDLLNYL